MKLKNSTNPLVVLYLMLEHHDYTYMYSDDNRVYRRGKSELREIKEYLLKYPETKQLYNSYMESRYDVSKTFQLGQWVDTALEVKWSNITIY